MSSPLNFYMVPLVETQGLHLQLRVVRREPPPLSGQLHKNNRTPTPGGVLFIFVHCFLSTWSLLNRLMLYPLWINCCKRADYDFCISQGSAATVLR